MVSCLSLSLILIYFPENTELCFKNVNYHHFPLYPTVLALKIRYLWQSVSEKFFFLPVVWVIMMSIFISSSYWYFLCCSVKCFADLSYITLDSYFHSVEHNWEVLSVEAHNKFPAWLLGIKIAQKERKIHSIDLFYTKTWNMDDYIAGRFKGKEFKVCDFQTPELGIISLLVIFEKWIGLFKI